MSDFTPEPWMFEYVNDDYWEVYAEINALDWAIAAVHGTGDYDADKANARLIVVAPRMHAFITEYISVCAWEGCDCKYCTEAQAILAEVAGDVEKEAT